MESSLSLSSVLRALGHPVAFQFGHGNLAVLVSIHLPEHAHRIKLTTATSATILRATSLLSTCRSLPGSVRLSNNICVLLNRIPLVRDAIQKLRAAKHHLPIADGWGSPEEFFIRGDLI